jgi:ABC-type Fe3+ transport system permease subunit
VHYPVSWDVGLVACAVIGFAAIVGVGIRRRRLRAGRVLLGFGAGFGLVVASTVIGAGAAALYQALYPNPNPNLSEYLLPSSAPYVAAAYGLIALLFGIGYWGGGPSGV